jgi:DDE superfamily endonuclease
MPTLPSEIIAVLMAFAPLFSRPVFAHVQILVIGALLAPGKRTITSALRIMGLQEQAHFQNWHRVLNRAKWSSRKAARILLDLLVRAFAPFGPLVIGIDETLERRQGDKIAALGIYRDAARSSKSFFVKASGLRWVSLMLLVPIPWGGRVWALPFLTVLAPSERYHQERGKRHKKLSDWARQMIACVRRWSPGRALVFVADGGYAVLELLAFCVRLSAERAGSVAFVTRLRLDAALYEPAPQRKPGQKGAPRKKGKRLPTLQQVLDDKKTAWTPITVARWYSQSQREIEIVSATCVWYHSAKPVVPIRYVLIRDPQGKFAPQALLCTDRSATPEQIVGWFVLRWQLETTFQEVRTHLGVETQRQWNDKAIARTTPALLGLFSLVTLLANRQAQRGELSVRQASWYVKERPTFSDALACVRRQLWNEALFYTSSAKADNEKIQQALFERFTDALCYAA